MKNAILLLEAYLAENNLNKPWKNYDFKIQLE